MKKLKVLHLASFIGNIGDNANHAGSRRWLSTLADFEFENLEIREFYWKNFFFDEKFSTKCNEYDLIVVGGGNYFELWVENSHTGTSIDISEKILSLIRTPILFYSLGVDAGQGYTDENLIRFKKFIDLLSIKPNKYFLSVRNDGSRHTVSTLFGEKFANIFIVIPDGGFFLDLNNIESSLLDKTTTGYIGINLAGDMPEKRFPDSKYNEILLEFCRVIQDTSALYPDYSFVFFSHILKDLNLLNDLFKLFDDSFFRKKVVIAPLMNGDYGMKQIFNMYSQCDLILGNRFHSNVVPIGLGIPTIGLVNYAQVRLLYKELNLSEHAVDISKIGFRTTLVELIRDSIDRKDEMKQRYNTINSELKLQMSNSYELLGRWLRNIM